MDSPVWDSSDNDAMICPIHGPPTRKRHRRNDDTPNGLAFLDLEAAVDHDNAGNEHGSETDDNDSMAGATHSKLYSSL